MYAHSADFHEAHICSRALREDFTQTGEDMWGRVNVTAAFHETQASAITFRNYVN